MSFFLVAKANLGVIASKIGFALSHSAIDDALAKAAKDQKGIYNKEELNKAKASLKLSHGFAAKAASSGNLGTPGIPTTIVASAGGPKPNNA